MEKKDGLREVEKLAAAICDEFDRKNIPVDLAIAASAHFIIDSFIEDGESLEDVQEFLDIMKMKFEDA